ncbi:helix-turn-helix domain-containing protein [Ruegeria arenilitoris]|uniref:helix-turn-helix domain-containing protein n=1 Tax=Ruegeria arenilitoris TaxID=1173585 RepID=UPI0014801D22|nr:helix-turn-helix transcriptional regulator [Ruegeria arenilitoris]
MLHFQEHPLPFFGPRLRRLRRAKGIKQQALAQLLGVDQITISRWEGGAQTPGADTQQAALAALGVARSNDTALRRLVETSSECIHLVEEASHVCLAYSAARARDWRVSQSALLGVSLWQFATDEIRSAEHALEQSDWWAVETPAPVCFVTSEAVHDQIRISAGGIRWERLYLTDGTPARLVSGD